MHDEARLFSRATSVLALSPGIAVGPAYIYKATGSVTPVATIHEDQVETELQHLQQALTIASQELAELSQRLIQTLGKDEAAIFEAQQLILADPDLLASVHDLIQKQHYTAASALHEVAEQQAHELEMLDNQALAARGVDVRDAVARAIRYLQGEEKRHLTFSHPVILLAYDLTPSDTANLDPESVLAICTVVGGFTTHAAIIARQLEIPAIAGIDADLLDELQDGEQVAVDGTRGLFFRSLSDEQHIMFSQAMQQQRKRLRLQDRAYWRGRAGSSADGVAVHVFANVGDRDSARAAGEAGAEGIGLLRTEFLFGDRPVFPGEQEQFDSYLTLFRTFAECAPLGKTIIARTLDAGADKPFPALESLIGPLREANPALGLRGARIHLLHEDLLRQQLRALLRASVMAEVHLHIMFPMIATVEEVRRLRSVYASVYTELTDAGITLPAQTQIGIMIETPAAALMADVLAREVDFFSIGANDLFQYTMAVDRTNSRVTGMFGRLEPAVWRLIERVVQAGVAQGKPVAVCGELAADPRIGPALAGLGVQELSVNPAAIIPIKAALHSESIAYWRELARKLLKAETAAEVEHLLQAP
jgi:phosphoenolpyruvate-protein phosphotransferase